MCDVCGAGDYLRTCSQCTFQFCPGCWLAHTFARIRQRQQDRGFICDLVAEAAMYHAAFRRDAEYRRYGIPIDLDLPPEAEDFAFARNEFRYHLRMRTRPC